MNIELDKVGEFFLQVLPTFNIQKGKIYPEKNYMKWQVIGIEQLSLKLILPSSITKGKLDDIFKMKIN